MPESEYSASMSKLGSIKLYRMLKVYGVGEPHTILRNAIELLNETKVAAIGKLPDANCGEQQYQLIADEPEASDCLVNPLFGPAHLYFDLSDLFAQRMLFAIAKFAGYKTFKSIALTNIRLELIQTIITTIKVSKIVLTIERSAFDILGACYKIFTGVNHAIYNIDPASLDGRTEYPMAESVETVEIYTTSNIFPVDLIPPANRRFIKRIGLNDLSITQADLIRNLFSAFTDVILRKSRHREFRTDYIKLVLIDWKVILLVVKADEVETLIESLRDDEQISVERGENACGEVEVRIVTVKSLYNIFFDVDNIESGDKSIEMSFR